MVIEQFSNWCQ